METPPQRSTWAISQNGTAANITETIQNRLSSALENTKEILEVCEDPRLIGFQTAMGPISEFETKVIPKLLNNAESWLVSARGTPKGMLCLDSQILSMKWKIVKIKLGVIAKTMGKPDNNLWKQALLEGQQTCNNEDLQTECINMCERLKVKCVSKGEPNAKEKLEIKKALWRENDEEIKEALMKSEKV